MTAIWDRIAALPHRFVTPRLEPIPVRSQKDSGLRTRRDARRREVARYLGKAIENGRPTHFLDFPKLLTGVSGASVDWNNFRVPIGDLFQRVTETSDIWSGALVQRPAAEPFNCIVGEWVVPRVSPIYKPDGFIEDGTYYCSVWVGIDGWGEGDLLQAGTMSSVVVEGGKETSYDFYAWKEWWKDDSVRLVESDFPVSPGDRITCTVCAPFDNTHGAALFYNRTKGWTTSVAIPPPATVSLTGTFAEWIVENPAFGVNPFPIYSDVTFTGCVASSKNYEKAASAGNDVDMVTADGVTLSTGTITGTHTVYCHYGP